MKRIYIISIFISVGVFLALIVFGVINFQEVPFCEEVNESGSVYWDEMQDQFSHVDKLHWWHMPLTYVFLNSNEDDFGDCQEHQVERIRDAFDIVEISTNGILSFKEEEVYGDIFISCHGATGKGVYMTEGTAEYEAMGDVITKATLKFFTHRNCGTWPDVEIHEVLHLFGYEHVDDEWSIMSPVAVRCDLGEIDNEIVQDLIEIYGKL